jgi:hypothetical protein
MQVKEQETQQTDPRAAKAVAVHDVLAETFKTGVSIHTYNALLSVFSKYVLETLPSPGSHPLCCYRLPVKHGRMHVHVPLRSFHFVQSFAL